MVHLKISLNASDFEPLHYWWYLNFFSWAMMILILGLINFED
ncbi:hypothetical protein HanPI659440_Chr12g0466951 [Helianthus annuus]|nr:hypothetical protein HanPI659440_Chr12g0466951 [Helianthus annuus]